jgi:WD40 repeat protein
MKAQNILVFSVALSFLLSACGQAQNKTAEQSNLPTGSAPSEPIEVEQVAVASVESTNTPVPKNQAIKQAILPENAGEIMQLFVKTMPAPGKVFDMQWSPDGSFLAVSGSGGIVLLDGSTLEIIREIQTNSRVGFLAISKDGRYLASNQFYPAIQIWDLGLGEVIRVLEDAGDIAAFSPDSKQIAVVTEEFDPNDAANLVETVIKLFDIESGSLISTMTAKTAFIEWTNTLPETSALIFNQDGSRLQAVNVAGDVRMWDTKTGKQLNSSLNNFTRQRLTNGYCLTDPDYGSDYMVGCMISYLDPPCTEDMPNCFPTPKTRFEMGFWNSNRFDRFSNKVILDPTIYLEYLAYASKAGKFAIIDGDRLQVWNVNDFSKPEIIVTNDDAVRWKSALDSTKSASNLQMTFKPTSEGNILAVSYEGFVELWDLQKQEPVAQISSDTRRINSAAIGFPQGNLVLASGLDDGTIVIDEIIKGGSRNIDKAHQAIIRSMTFAENGETLISNSQDGLIRTWAIKDSELSGEVSYSSPRGLISLGYDTPISSGNKYMLVSQFDPASDMNVQTWMDVSTLKGINQIETDAGHAAVSLDGKWLAAGDYEIRLWDLGTGEFIREFQLPINREIKNIALSPNGSLLAASLEDKFVIWDINTSEMFTYNVDAANAHSLVFSPNGCLLAMGTDRGKVSLLDLNTKKIVFEQAAHRNTVIHLSFSPDGHLLLSVGEQDHAIIWGLDGALQIPGGYYADVTCNLASVPLTSTPITPTNTSAPIEATSTPTPTTLTRTLKLTDPPLAGDDVMLLQQRLASLGYTEVGIPDGVFGRMTDQAVKEFQERSGLVVDGVVGPVTWDALFRDTAIKK